jgi:hypothetical protein
MICDEDHFSFHEPDGGVQDLEKAPVHVKPLSNALGCPSVTGI